MKSKSHFSGEKKKKKKYIYIYISECRPLKFYPACIYSLLLLQNV